MLVFEPTIKIGQLNTTLFSAIAVFQRLRANYTLEPMVVTSLNDSEHINGSLHFLDKAVDIRSHDLPNLETKLALLGAFRHEVANDISGVPMLGLILEFAGQPDEHYHLQVGVEHLKEYW